MWDFSSLIFLYSLSHHVVSYPAALSTGTTVTSTFCWRLLTMLKLRSAEILSSIYLLYIISIFVVSKKLQSRNTRVVKKLILIIFSQYRVLLWIEKIKSLIKLWIGVVCPHLLKFSGFWTVWGCFCMMVHTDLHFCPNLLFLLFDLFDLLLFFLIFWQCERQTEVC